MDRRTFLGAATAGGLACALPRRAIAAPAAKPMLGAVRAITIAAPDLAKIESAYTTFLGYRTVWRGSVPADTARSWGAPAVAGRRVVVMAPSSGEPTYFRFVEQPLSADYRPLTTFGWNAAELIVQDPFALAARLKNSPFEIIGKPRPLVGFPAEAMQVVGPAKEVLYFTHFDANPAHPEIKQPEAFVDYCFVAVAGAPNMDAALAYYNRTFGNAINTPFEIVNPIISDANHLPAETMHRLNTIGLDKGKMIEMDQFPSVATPRAKPHGGLAPGISLVTFAYADLDRHDLGRVGQAAPSMMPPVSGRPTVTLVGGAGELIELVGA